MKHLKKINGREYAFEYTIEASMYEDFVDRVTTWCKDMMLINENKMTPAEKGGAFMKTQVTQVPKLALIGFYAGLMEHEHVSYEEAKELYKTYLREYNKTPLQVILEFMEMAGEDNFFTLIGLDMDPILPQKKQAKSKKIKVISKQ